MKDENFQKLLLYAEKIIQIRPRSEKEIREKLNRYSQKRHFPDNCVNSVIGYLQEQNLVNDEDFVSWWINQRDYFKPKGERAIYFELMSKGVDRKIIEKVVRNSKNARKNSVELAESSLGKKIFIYKSLSNEIWQAKITGFLLRRGFDYQTIESVIDSLKKKFYNTDTRES
jgi:regulatory protein